MEVAGGRLTRPAISPDGRTVAVLHESDDDDKRGFAFIKLFEVGTETPLAVVDLCKLWGRKTSSDSTSYCDLDAGQLSFSPDGTYLLASSRRRNDTDHGWTWQVVSMKGKQVTMARGRGEMCLTARGQLREVTSRVDDNGTRHYKLYDLALPTLRRGKPTSIARDDRSEMLTAGPRKGQRLLGFVDCYTAALAEIPEAYDPVTNRKAAASFVRFDVKAPSQATESPAIEDASHRYSKLTYRNVFMWWLPGFHVRGRGQVLSSSTKFAVMAADGLPVDPTFASKPPPSLDTYKDSDAFGTHSATGRLLVFLTERGGLNSPGDWTDVFALDGTTLRDVVRINRIGSASEVTGGDVRFARLNHRRGDSTPIKLEVYDVRGPATP